MRLLRKTKTSALYTEVDGETLRWATTEWVSQRLLDELKASRNQNKRAPIGDRHGSWQKVAELPLSLVLQKIPMPDWEDTRAWKKLVNDPDLRYFRADGEHRRF